MEALQISRDNVPVSLKLRQPEEESNQDQVILQSGLSVACPHRSARAHMGRPFASSEGQLFSVFSFVLELQTTQQNNLQDVFRRQSAVYDKDSNREWYAHSRRGGDATPSKLLAPQVWSVILSFQVLCSPSQSCSLCGRSHDLPCALSCERWLPSSSG